MDLKDPVVSTAVLLHKVHLIQPSPPHPPIHNYDYNELLTGGEIPNSGVSIKPRAVHTAVQPRRGWHPASLSGFTPRAQGRT